MPKFIPYKKLSKRSGHSSFEDLLAEGYLVEAVINYLVLLGWSPRGEREFFTLKELTKDKEKDTVRYTKAPDQQPQKGNGRRRHQREETELPAGAGSDSRTAEGNTPEAVAAQLLRPLLQRRAGVSDAVF